MYKSVNGIFMLAALLLVLFMATDTFKELDRVHRVYVGIAFLCSALPAFFMAYLDGYAAGKNDGGQALSERMLEDQTYLKETAALQADREEYLAVHAALDHSGVPRTDADGKLLTLYGRLHHPSTIPPQLEIQHG